MRIIGAYMLAKLSGNDNPDASAIADILDSIGQKADEERIKLFLSQIEGQDIAEVIEKGSKKLGAVGGPAGGAAAGPAGDAEGGENKKEEKKEEEEDDIIDFSDEDE